MKYVVTGVLRNGKRFSRQYSDKHMALCVNLWCGNVWEVDASGKRKRINSVCN